MDGYMIDVQWDGATLRVHGKNKAARIALNGQNHEQDVVIQRDEIASVEHRKPRIMGAINGNLIVFTTSGARHQLHYRKKSAAQFAELARQLQPVPA